MSRLEFQEEQLTGNGPRSKREPKMVAKLISLGLAKNAQQATYILYGFLVVMCIISFLAIRSMSAGPTQAPIANPNYDPDPEDGQEAYDENI